MSIQRIFTPKYIIPILAIGCTILASPAFAQTVTHSGEQFDGLLKLIQQNSTQWNGRLLGYAEKLFWALATIQLVMTFMPLAIRQADIGEIVGGLKNQAQRLANRLISSSLAIASSGVSHPRV